MLGEGIDPVTIERAATQMGFPAPPLAMVDEVSLVLPQKIAAEAAKAAEAAGAGAFASPAMKVVDRMVDEFDRKGKAAGAGFYDYPAGDGKTKKTLWPGLWDHFVDPAKNPVSDEVFHDLQERFTFVMSLETIKCVDEGVLRSTRGRQHRVDLRHRLPAPVRRCAAVRQQLPGPRRDGERRARLPGPGS